MKRRWVNFIVPLYVPWLRDQNSPATSTGRKQNTALVRVGQAPHSPLLCLLPPSLMPLQSFLESCAGYKTKTWKRKQASYCLLPKPRRSMKEVCVFIHPVVDVKLEQSWWDGFGLVECIGSTGEHAWHTSCPWAHTVALPTRNHSLGILIPGITNWKPTWFFFSILVPPPAVHQVLAIVTLKYLGGPSASLHPSANFLAQATVAWLPAQQVYLPRSPHTPTPPIIGGPYCCQGSVYLFKKHPYWKSSMSSLCPQGEKRKSFLNVSDHLRIPVYTSNITFPLAYSRHSELLFFSPNGPPSFLPCLKLFPLSGTFAPPPPPFQPTPMQSSHYFLIVTFSRKPSFLCMGRWSLHRLCSHLALSDDVLSWSVYLKFPLAARATSVTNRHLLSFC